MNKAFGATALAIMMGAGAVSAALAELTPQRQNELVHMLRHDCGSCHGMTLQGGLGPALTPDALSNKPVEYLFHTVKHGHPGTPMPPWSAILNDDEISYLVTTIKKGVSQ